MPLGCDVGRLGKFLRVREVSRHGPVPGPRHPHFHAQPLSRSVAEKGLRRAINFYSIADFAGEEKEAFVGHSLPRGFQHVHSSIPSSQEKASAKPRRAKFMLRCPGSFSVKQDLSRRE